MTTSNAHVKWAQRKKELFVTIEATDADEVKVELDNNNLLRVTGTGITKVGMASSPFSVSLALFGKAESTSFKVTGYSVQVRVAKAEPGYWDRLTAEASKTHKNWLTCDWSLWKDEDEEKEGEKLDFGGRFDDGLDMLNSGAADEDSDDNEQDEKPPADLSDLGVPN